MIFDTMGVAFIKKLSGARTEVKRTRQFRNYATTTGIAGFSQILRLINET